MDKFKQAMKLREVPLENGPAPIPGDEQFKADFLDDEWLQERGRDLVRDKLDIELGQFDIRFLWKQGGGRRNGKAILGKTSLPRSYAKFYSRADALIWVAADHLRALEASHKFLDAVLYHELCHLKFDPEDGLFLVGHDFEGFAAEFKEYGAWRTDLKDLTENLKQLKLL